LEDSYIYKLSISSAAIYAAISEVSSYGITAIYQFFTNRHQSFTHGAQKRYVV